MIRPAYLKKGDTVGFVSTARKISSEDILTAIQKLESWGLKAIVGKTIDSEYNQFAGDDNLRIADFQAMLDNPDVKAIWCSKGGYGTVRIIDKLDFTEFKKYPKWLIGYSDITVLHSHLHNLGYQSLHAQIPVGFTTKPEPTIRTLQNALFGLKQDYEILSDPKNRLGKANGQLVGGNLSILYSLCGSPSALNTEGKILFIEDLDEYLYHIDRMMQNLKRNGYFNNLSGLIVGGMTDMNDNAVPYGKTAEEIIIETVGEYDFPVCFGFPAGHMEDNRALIMGGEVAMDVSSEIVQVVPIENKK